MRLVTRRRTWYTATVATLLLIEGIYSKYTLSECPPELCILEYCPYFYEIWDIDDAQIAPDACYSWQVCFDCDGSLRYDCIIISHSTVLVEMYHMVACWNDLLYGEHCMCWFDLNDDGQLDLRDLAITQNHVRLWH